MVWGQALLLPLFQYKYNKRSASCPPLIHQPQPRWLDVVLLVVAWLMAAKEALDLDWGQPFSTEILGLIVWVAIWIHIRGALALMGHTARAVGGVLRL